MRTALFFSILLVTAGCEGSADVEQHGLGSGPTLRDSGEPGLEGDGGLGPVDAGSSRPTTPPDECGDTRLATSVIYGTAEPTFLPLSAGQIRAIGRFESCTGVLIAPKWVLTAAHCDLAEGANFCMGADPNNANQCVRSARVVAHPSRDLALVELVADAASAAPGVTPISVQATALPQSFIGNTAETAGYGRTETGASGSRRFTALPVAGLAEDVLTLDGQGRSGPCFGEAGAPALIMGDGGIRVAATLNSVSNDSCVGYSHFARVDDQGEWISSLVGASVAPGDDACGGVSTRGRCINGEATWCEGTRSVTDRCGDGTTCGWDASADGFRCITGVDPCGGVDGAGTCDGNIASWCDRGVKRTRDCGECGQTCGIVSEVGGAYCVGERATTPPPGPLTDGGTPDSGTTAPLTRGPNGETCQELGYYGACADENMLVFCDGTDFHQKDCRTEGKECGFVDATIGFDCR